MKKCPNCGAQMADDTNFCTNCGTDLRNVTINDKPTQLNNSSIPNNEINEQKRQNYQQTTQHIIDTEQTKHIATNYWKWLVKSWAKPTNNEILTSKWFGVISIILETVLLCASFFALMQRITLFLSATNNITNAISALFGGQFNNNTSIHFNAFGISFEILIILLILNTAILGAVYGINCWVFKEKENFWNFINRFAHYTNMILIINCLLFLLCMITNAYSMIIIIIVLSIFFYILGMLATILTRQGTQRFDRIYASIFVVLIILIVPIIILSICGNTIN